MTDHHHDTPVEVPEMGGEREGEAHSPPSPTGWNQPLPLEIPDPTWVPSALAFGITLLFWGVATSPIVSGVGLIAIFISLGFWIGEMCRER